MTEVMPRNQLVPVRRRVVLTNVNLNKTEIKVRIFEGPRAFVRDNQFVCEISLGEMRISLLQSIAIEVTVAFNHDGVPLVEADVYELERKGHCEFHRNQRVFEDRSFEQEGIESARDEEELERLDLSKAVGDLVPFHMLKWPPTSECDYMMNCVRASDPEFYSYRKPSIQSDLSMIKDEL